MTNHATLLRQIRAEARPYIEQWLEIGEVFAGFRKLAADNDLDWGVIKALIKAEVQDEQDEGGGSKRVTKIIDKADCASAYADMLGLGGGEEKINFSSEPDIGIPISLPLHDEDGVIIEPASAPSDAEAGQEGDRSASSVALASEEGADAIALDAPSSQIKSNAKATEVEPGNAGGTVPVRHNNDRAGVASRLAGGRTPDSEEGGSCALGASPSSRPLSPCGEFGATGTNGGSHAHEVASTPDSKSSDNRQVLGMDREPPQSEFARRGNASVKESVTAGETAPNSEVAAIAPASAAIAPVEQSPFRDVAPGAPHSGEMPDIPAFLDRRRISEAAA